MAGNQTLLNRTEGSGSLTSSPFFLMGVVKMSGYCDRCQNSELLCVCKKEEKPLTTKGDK